MPDWVQEVIHNIPRFGAVFALFPVCFKVFSFVEDRLSIKVKEELSAWLKSTGNFAESQILSFNLSRFHSQLFGDKQLSLKCVQRSILFSFISYSLVSLPTVVWQAFIISKYGKFPLSNDYITISLNGFQTILIFVVIFIIVIYITCFSSGFLRHWHYKKTCGSR